MKATKYEDKYIEEKNCIISWELPPPLPPSLEIQTKFLNVPMGKIPDRKFNFLFQFNVGVSNRETRSRVFKFEVSKQVYFERI